MRTGGLRAMHEERERRLAGKVTKPDGYPSVNSPDGYVYTTPTRAEIVRQVEQGLAETRERIKASRPDSLSSGYCDKCGARLPEDRFCANCYTNKQFKGTYHA